MSKKLISLAYLEGAKDAVNSIAQDIKSGLDPQMAILRVREMIMALVLKEQRGKVLWLAETAKIIK